MNLYLEYEKNFKSLKKAPKKSYLKWTKHMNKLQNNTHGQ